MYSTAKPSTESFGPFLRTVRGIENSQGGSVSSSGVLTTRVLDVLAQRGPLSARDLLQASKISVLDIAGILTTMRELGLVEVTQQDDNADEVIQLSPTGSRLVAQTK